MCISEILKRVKSKDLFNKVLICLLLTLSVLTVYWQVNDFEFINYDDPRYVNENHVIRQGVTLPGIRWAFGEVYASNWHPLTWISHMIDVELFGLDPGKHHLVNVLLHVLNTILLFLVLERMTGAIWRCAAVAAIFAVHPMHVESVAWISERKDVLSTFFWMLTMMGYLWYVKRRTALRYLGMLLWYVLGLLSKPMLVTLPCVLLILDFWPLRRWDPFQKDTADHARTADSVCADSPNTGFLLLVLEKIPLMILALVSSVITFYAQKSGGAVSSLEQLDLGYRLLNAVTAYAAYLCKMVWPVHLSVFYPYPEGLSAFVVAFSAGILLLISVSVALLAKKHRYLIAGWSWYLGTLVPVIGIVQVGAQSMADRYTYIPSIGILIMVVWGLSDLLSGRRQGMMVAGTAAVSATLLLMATTWVQVGFWRTSETLFRHALGVTRNNYVAHNKLGLALFEKGDIAGAISHFRATIRISPNYPKGYINLGQALALKKDYQGASENYRKSLSIDPSNADAHAGLGTLLAGMNRVDDAGRHFADALRTNPGSIEAHNNLGNLLLQTGDYDEAIRQYSEALRIDPHNAEVYNNMGTAFVCKGELEKAIECFSASVREQPGYADGQRNLQNARVRLQKLEDSAEKVQKMIRDDPRDPALHTRLGDVYRQMGAHEKAIDQYRMALTMRPAFMQAMYGLVLVYSGTNEYAHALDILLKMRQAQPHNPDIYYNISCIYAKQNNVEESVAWLRKSVGQGFSKWELIENDPDLKNIRETAYVAQLLRQHKR